MQPWIQPWTAPRAQPIRVGGLGGWSMFVGEGAGDEWGGGGDPSPQPAGGTAQDAAAIATQQQIGVLKMQLDDLSNQTGGQSAEVEALRGKVVALLAYAIGYVQNGIGTYQWMKDQYAADKAAYQSIMSRAVPNKPDPPVVHPTPAGPIAVPPSPAAEAAKPPVVVPAGLSMGQKVGLGALALGALGFGAKLLKLW